MEWFYFRGKYHNPYTIKEVEFLSDDRLVFIYLADEPTLYYDITDKEKASIHKNLLNG